mmetsp:Transcript_24759/g.44776  ORF Transcript_24759/g.44776 Transcript_24759/m.44776 type:complete len:108 (+) Transcript_24759:600-923(+)
MPAIAGNKRSRPWHLAEYPSGSRKEDAHATRDKEALAMAVLDAWENGLSSESFTKVCNRLQNILALIVEDKGGNAETLMCVGELHGALQRRKVVMITIFACVIKIRR